MLVRRAARLLPWVDRKLRNLYGDHPDTPLGNKSNPLDELVYIQLSVRTPEDTYQATYPALRRLVGGAWRRLLSLREEEIVERIRGGGMARVKVRRILGMLERINQTFGRVSLAPLARMSDEEADQFLQSLPGVGPKVARCVLLYSLQRDVFPVDSHCLRVLSRLGLVAPEIDRKAAHNFLQALVPSGLRRSLHINFVLHGRAVCTPFRPACGQCVLSARCPSGAKRLN